jgi:hypothetical protein
MLAPSLETRVSSPTNSEERNMNQKTQMRIAQITCVVMALAVAGCASTLSEDELYEQQVHRAEQVEQIQGLIRTCEAASRTVVYTGPTTHKLRDPVKRIPKHARPIDFQCVGTREVDAMQAEF